MSLFTKNLVYAGRLKQGHHNFRDDIVEFAEDGSIRGMIWTLNGSGLSSRSSDTPGWQ
jgi:hypothetical protein